MAAVEASDYRRMFGVAANSEGVFVVVEVEAAVEDWGWTVRKRRGSTVLLQPVLITEARLYDTREAAEAHLSELIEGSCGG